MADVLDRNALFEDNMDWAAKIARSFAKKLPPCFNVRDMEQEARIECWKQAQKYDPSRGVPFQAYAYFAVLGACRMAVRRRHWSEAIMPEVDPYTVDIRPQGEDAIAAECDRVATDQRIETQRAAIASELATLPEIERRLIARVLEGADLSEIEAGWQDETATVGRRLSVATRMLKKRFRTQPVRACETRHQEQVPAYREYRGRHQVLKLLRQRFGVPAAARA